MEGGAVSDTALDAAHVATTDLGDVCEGFLRQVLLLSERADSRPKPLEGGVLGGLACLARHAKNAGALHHFGPRPMGYNECHPPWPL